MKLAKWLGNSALVILLSGFLFLGGRETAGYMRLEKETDALRQEAQADGKSGETEESSGQSRKRQLDFQTLKAVNPDIRGWIWLPGTGVDYPVLIGREEGMYLKRNFKGEADPLGSVFSYVGTDLSADSRVCLFGHNLISGQMFGSLKKFLDQTFAEEHREAFLYTPGGCREYQFLSAVSCRMEEVFQQKEAYMEKVLSLITCGGGEGTVWRTVVNFIEV